MPPEQGDQPGGRQRLILVIALAAALAGIAVLVFFVFAQDESPQPSSSGTVAPSQTTGPTDSPSGGTGGGASGRKHHDKPQNTGGDEPLGASRPVSISIEALDVAAEVIPIGKTPDGALAVPKGKNIDKAAWYENSPTPGQTGPSVIEGHIDTDDGPSVFYRLAALQPGEKITVARADGTRVEFSVTRVRDYPSKTDFPTRLVYGGDLSKPSLRLVTCSNFDQSTGHYAGNTVVYADRTTVHKKP